MTMWVQVPPGRRKTFRRMGAEGSTAHYHRKHAPQLSDEYRLAETGVHTSMASAADHQDARLPRDGTR